MDKIDLGNIAISHSGDESPNKAKSVNKSKVTESFTSKKHRIRRELIKAGMTRYGLSKFNTRYLPSIIKNGEHINGVVYGRYIEGPGWLSWVDRMMVATDHRIISFNHKPGYTDDAEFTYDVVNGVDSSRAGPFTAVTLDTRAGKVEIRFVNKRCSETFIKYVERKRLDFFRTRTRRDLTETILD